MTHPSGGLQFQYAGVELAAMAYARNYYRWIALQFAPHLGRSVVEVGAGQGTFSAQLLSLPIESLCLLEPAKNLVPTLTARFEDDPRVDVRRAYLEDLRPSSPPESIVAVNVLEHIEDDREWLACARSLLRPGGALLLFVPAMQGLYGSLDRAFEHYRRYALAGLRDLVGEAGFRIVTIRRVNSLGVAAWFLAGRVLRSTSLSMRSVSAYDRLVLPWLLRLEERVPPPIGQSILLAARADA